MKSVDSWGGIRNKVFPSLTKRRRIVITKKRPDNPDENAIYIQVRPSEFKMKRIGKPGVEKNFLEIYSKKEFIFPELGNLSHDVDLLDSDVRDGTCARRFIRLEITEGNFQTSIS